MAAVLGLVAGCEQQTAVPVNTVQPAKIKIGFVARRANDYWSLVRFGCDTAVVTLGDVELDFRTPAGRTAADQNQLLNDLVASGVKAVAISPIEGDQQTAALNSAATNVLLVCADNDASGSLRTAYIGTDNVAAGAQAAQLLKAALPQGGKIAVLVGSSTAQNARDRIKGLTDALAGTRVEIVDTVVDDMSPTTALENAQKAIAAHPDLVGMVGLYSYDGPAILNAVKSAGKVGKIRIVCFDSNMETLEGIAAGEIYGTIVQDPYTIGNRTVQLLTKYLRGDKSVLAAGKIHIPSQIVTSENVAEYQRMGSRPE